MIVDSERAGSAVARAGNSESGRVTGTNSLMCRICVVPEMRPVGDAVFQRASSRPASAHAELEIKADASHNWTEVEKPRSRDARR